jgi:hypothetical protein
MSAVTRPRGPLPARVYWTRRLLVLGLAFLLVFVIGRVLGGGSDGSSSGGTARQVAGAPSSTPASNGAAPSRTATQKPKKVRKAKPTTPPLAQPDGPCDPEDVTVVPRIRRGIAGSPIRIGFKLVTDVPACSFTFSNNTVAVKIISGTDRIWTSQQCRTLPTVEDLVVRAEKPERLAMHWSGRRSNDGCKLFSAPWAEKGYYHVVAATLGGEPTDQQFKLVNPSPRTVTKAPKPEQRDKQATSPTDKPTDKPTGKPTDEPTGATPSGATEPS